MVISLTENIENISNGNYKIEGKKHTYMNMKYRS